MYRTAPLAGLWSHQKGGFFHERPLRHASRRGEPLRRALQAKPHWCEQEGSGRVPKGDL